MSRIRHVQRVEAPTDDVFRVATRIDRMPRWDRSVADLPGLPGVADEGTSWDGELRLAGHTIPMTATVLELARPTRLRIRWSSPGGCWLERRVGFQPAGTGTLVSFEVDYGLAEEWSAGSAGAELADSIERLLVAAAESLARLAEAAARAKVEAAV